MKGFETRFLRDGFTSSTFTIRDAFTFRDAIAKQVIIA